MRYTKPQPTVEHLRAAFDYRDDAERRVNGFTMRGGFMRRHHPRRLVCGSLVPGEPTSRATAKVPGSGVHYLHRLVWVWHHGAVPTDRVVDHCDGDPSNNRIGNLRLLTDRQNQFNRFQSRRDSTVPYLGVCRTGGGFNAFTSESGKPVYLGFFRCAVEAAIARDSEAEKRGGGFARLNRDLFTDVRHRYQLNTNTSPE